MTSSDPEIHFRKIPSVSTIIESLQESGSTVHPLYLKRIAAFVTGHIRSNPKRYKLDSVSREELKTRVLAEVRQKTALLQKGSLGKVINATGVVLHTGMGRAPLHAEIVEQLKDISRYCNLEIRLDDGKRGQRNDHLSFLLHILTGAGDGLAVNNNAAAVMLMLNTVGKGKEVIISRGEMIEIGGSFRMPDVMRVSGCKLCEVGTTNKTHLKDYEAAVSAKTGAILLCHPSNYEVQGFTNKPSIEEIVAVGHRHDIPVIYDLGSGSLIDTRHYGSDSEPVVPEMVDQGLDLISFSGDKLLGGPQAGIIVGKQKWVDRCRKNQLLRALRLDKFMIKILQLTLSRYLEAGAELPDLDSVKALTTVSDMLKKRSLDFMEALPQTVRDNCALTETKGKVGSGAYPLMELNSWAVSLKHPRLSPNTLSARLRNRTVPVFSYIENDTVYLDLRTVSAEETPLLKEAILEVFS